MERIVVYHGSERVIEKPLWGKGDPHSDYGSAFYCTRELFAAKEWANKRREGGFANKYLLDARGLKVLDLTDKKSYGVLNWFAILMHFRKLDPTFQEDYARELLFLERRYYIEVSDYDIVLGYRADDSYFLFPLMFLRGELRLERLETIYSLGYLGEQIAVISEKAFSRLSFLEAIPAEPIYKEKYKTRIAIADDRFRQKAREERYLEGKRILDLVRQDDKG